MKVLALFGETIDCAGLRGRAEALVLEHLTARERDACERHLSSCAACRQHVAAAHELFALLPLSLPAEGPPPDVLLRVLERVRAPARRRRVRGIAAAMTGSAAAAAFLMALIAPSGAAHFLESLGMLESPDIAVIDLFLTMDSPLTSHYEYQTESDIRYDRAVGRVFFNMADGDWRLLVHGLPRPPRHSRYVLSARVEGHEIDLGTIERWEDGVAVLQGRSDVDLLGTERLWIQLVSPHSRLPLLGDADL